MRILHLKFGRRSAECGICVSVALLCLWGVVLIGCAPSSRSLAFLGGQGTVIGKGWAVSGPTGPSVIVELANRGTEPLRLSYGVDAYIAKTRDGRTLTLAKTDFLTYPDQLAPGQDGSVALGLPKDLLLEDISRLIARLEVAQLVVSMDSLTGPPPSEGIVRAQTPGAPSVLVPQPPAGMFEVEGAAQDTVPVEVQFQQELGTSLTLDLRWNESAQAVALASGTGQTFYVEPGAHQLAVRCDLPMMTTTAGRMSVVVSPGEPLRVTVDARAALTGVELHVRVFSQQRLIAERTFKPSAPS